MTSSRRTLLRVTGCLITALLLGGPGRAPRASAGDAAPAFPVRLIIRVENIDFSPHPIRIAIDGRPVFRRIVRGPTLINWPLFGERSRRQTVRLTAGAHQLTLEEDATHIVQQTQIDVTRPCDVRVGFWPWYQDGRFRQEPHFTVTMRPPASQGAS